MDVAVRLDRTGSLAAQIYGQLRAAVLDGRLRCDEALPASRELAEQLKVSRNTVTAAYERLVAEGYLTGRPGAGTFVNALPHAEQALPLLSAGPLTPRAVWPTMPVPPDFGDTPEFDFRVGSPDARLFPYAAWRRLLTNQFRPSAVGSGMSVESAGHFGLRTVIACICGRPGPSRHIRRMCW